MRNIAIIVPTEREMVFFPEYGIRAYTCGVGMAECAACTANLLAASLPLGRRLDLVILAGIAGTYTDRFSIGDTVMVESETIVDLGRRNPDGNFTPLFQKTYPASFTIAEQFPIVHSNTVNMAGVIISPSSEALIENMEGAAFFAVSKRFGVPAMEIRTISNRVGEPVTPAGLDLSTRRLAGDMQKIIGSYNRLD